MVVRSRGDLRAPAPLLAPLRPAAAAARLPARARRPAGRTTTYPRDTAFVVELPGGRSASRRRPAATPAPCSTWRARSRRRAWCSARSRSRQERKEQMRAYARRHYGIDDYRLRRPRVIVQHYTVTDDFQSTYNTFAPNVPDPELGELPGRLRALRDRQGRHDLPARADLDHVPPHRRPELHLDRHRARRPLGRPGARQPRASWPRRCASPATSRAASGSARAT